jgi:hypothetical protein
VVAVSSIAGSARSLTPVARLGAWASLQETACNLRAAETLIADALRSFDSRSVGTAQGVVPAVLESDAVTLRAATATTLTSTAQVNTTATSYSPYAPAWTGSTAAAVTLNGTYGGSTDDTLTFTVTQLGILGLLPYHIRVTNGAGQTT